MDRFSVQESSSTTLYQNEFLNTTHDTIAPSQESFHDDCSSDLQFIVTGSKAKFNAKLLHAVKTFSIVVEFSDDGLDYLQETEDYNSIFVIDDFECEAFHKLHDLGARILGPPIIMQCAEKNEPLPQNHRPLYCNLMDNLVLCFTGFRVKESLCRMADLVHHMGGSIRKDFSMKITHLVSNTSHGEKYRAAVNFGTPVLLDRWIYSLWDRKDILTASCSDPDLGVNTLQPFTFSVISFLGFSTDEVRHMEHITVQHGGTYAEPGAPTCTHLVVDDRQANVSAIEKHSRLQVVKPEWFWGSVQMNACADESMYRLQTPATPSSGKTSRHSAHTPASSAKSRKRKRLLRDNLAQLAADPPEVGMSPRSLAKRKSSLGGSFLDATVDSSGNEAIDDKIKSPKTNKSSVTARQMVVTELLQTEKNFVKILHTILTVFKEEVESSDQPGGPLLDPTEVKMIFGKIMPIYEVHTKIRDELASLVTNWKEDAQVASIILKRADRLMHIYPPFLNFFENTKATIQQCEKMHPRFHAFLKVCLSRPECGRQTLAELLIRPVQRLPSIILLLKDILKKTDEGLSDHADLHVAIEKLEEVMTHLNEDKKKAEAHQTMFDTVNDIENCPPELLSSHRQLVSRVNVVELGDVLSGRGDSLTLFLFTDMLEICKRRVKLISGKSPGAVATASSAVPRARAHKHVEAVQLTSIKKVVNITDTPRDCQAVFALVVRPFNAKEKLYAFLLVEEEPGREAILRTLCRQIADTTCRADYENLLTSLPADQLEIDVSDLSARSLSKVASKFSKRVSRAFSFNKTPRKLKKTMSSVSQMMSPFRRESIYHPGGSTTPVGDLRAMRLASTNDLTSSSFVEDQSSCSASLRSFQVDSPGCVVPPIRRNRSLRSFASSLAQAIPRRLSRRHSLVPDACPSGSSMTPKNNYKQSPIPAFSPRIPQLEKVKQADMPDLYGVPDWEVAMFENKYMSRSPSMQRMPQVNPKQRINNPFDSSGSIAEVLEASSEDEEKVWQSPRSDARRPDGDYSLAFCGGNLFDDISCSPVGPPRSRRQSAQTCPCSFHMPAEGLTTSAAEEFKNGSMTIDGHRTSGRALSPCGDAEAAAIGVATQLKQLTIQHDVLGSFCDVEK